MDAYRILVTGSRDWTDEATIHFALNHYLLHLWRTEQRHVVVVHGACPSGADRIADRWAKANGVAVERHPARWGTHGKKAGPVRNYLMVAGGADVCLAFIKANSRGASHCAMVAQRNGIAVTRYRE